MKLILLFLFLSTNVTAGLLDFLDIKQANDAYKNKNYQLAAEKFANIDQNTARLNHASSLYKQGLYQQALEKYQSIKQPELEFKRLYNSGNTYAKLKKINEAIASYEAALKLKTDADARSNLKLLKKQKRKRKDKEQANKNKKQKKNQAQKKQKQGGSKKKPEQKIAKEKGKNKQQAKKLDAIKQQRWEKSLNRRLRTLLIPLNKQKDNSNEKNLW